MINMNTKHTMITAILLTLLVATAGCSQLAQSTGDTNDEQPKTVAVDSSGNSGNEGDSATTTVSTDMKIVRIAYSGNEPVYYEFNATAPIQFAGGADPKGGEVHADGVNGNRAWGTIKHGDADTFKIPADAGVVRFVNYDDGKLQVTVAGNPIDIDAPTNPSVSGQSSGGNGSSSNGGNAGSGVDTDIPSQTTEYQVLWIKAPQGTNQRYEFVASANIKPGSKLDSSSEAINSDYAGGVKASGSVGEGGVDTFLIPEGAKIIEFHSYGVGQLTVTLDGNSIEVNDHEPDTPTPVPRVDARIDGFNPSGGTYIMRTGVEQTATVTVTNTGNVKKTFFVGYLVIGPNGEKWNNDDTTGKWVTLEPGETEEVTLRWNVESEASTGYYDANTAIWLMDSSGDLVRKIDQKRVYNAFKVVSSQGSSSNGEKYTLVVKSTDGGTSKYIIYGTGIASHTTHNENTDYTADSYVRGIIGEYAEDRYKIEENHISTSTIKNKGNSTLKIFVDGTLVRTVPPKDTSDGRNKLVIKATGEGVSSYTTAFDGSAKPAPKADLPDEAKRPDQINEGMPSVEINGYVGSGGVDSYYVTGLYGSLTNHGNATLKVYYNGELCMTVEPNSEDYCNIGPSDN